MKIKWATNAFLARSRYILAKLVAITMNDFYFFLIGLFSGALGTLVGAGGGFVLAPLFVFLFPDMSAARLTSISLLAVAANSYSGSIGYALRKSVHWPSVFLFTLTASPGVILGVWLSQSFARSNFEIAFAVFLSLTGIFVIWRSLRRNSDSDAHNFWTPKNKWLGSIASFFIGGISSLLGVGGGIIHVPLLAEFLRYPVRLATGTSQAILALTSSIAVIEHLRRGSYNFLEAWVPFLVLGLVIGAQGGAAISKHIKGKIILRILGLALLSVAIRLLYKNT
jgi:uncharacterized membrane protein YfcA